MIEDEEKLRVSDPAQHAEMYGDVDPVAHREQLETGARITDKELLERLERSLRWGI